MADPEVAPAIRGAELGVDPDPGASEGRMIRLADPRSSRTTSRIRSAATTPIRAVCLADPAWSPCPALDTPHTIRHYIGEAQRRAGLPRTGPHLLRHTALTRLAKLGASVYVVQAVARHSRLQTTQTYLHTQQIGLAREAAELLDRAAPRGRAPPPRARAAPRGLALSDSAAEPPVQ